MNWIKVLTVPFNYWTILSNGSIEWFHRTILLNHLIELIDCSIEEKDESVDKIFTVADRMAWQRPENQFKL